MSCISRKSVRSAFQVVALCTFLSSNPALSGYQTSRLPSAQSPTLSKVTYDNYILGTGDKLAIELLDLPELSGTYSVGPSGSIYLPRLRALNMDGDIVNVRDSAFSAGLSLLNEATVPFVGLFSIYSLLQ
tara:strand:- start:50 stop:439 length:390 start_codon:yes stop_codon:yes gene_type:complete